MYVVKPESVKDIQQELMFHDYEAGFIKIGDDRVLALPYHNRKHQLPGASFFGAPQQQVVKWVNAAGEEIILDFIKDWGTYLLYISKHLVLTTAKASDVYDLITFVNETHPTIVFGSFKTEAVIGVDRNTKLSLEHPLGVRRLHGCKAVFWRMQGVHDDDFLAYMWPTRLDFGKKYGWYERAADSVDLFIGGRILHIEVLSGLKEWPVKLDGEGIPFGRLLDIFQELGVDPIPVYPL